MSCKDFQRICVCATHVSRLNADCLAFRCYYDRGSAAPMSFSSLRGDKPCDGAEWHEHCAEDGRVQLALKGRP